VSTKPKGDIGNRGRSWLDEEACERFQLTPEKFEMVERSFFFGNVGADRALQFGHPDVWPRAVAKLPR
jgi:hypothetical protein